MCLDEELNLIFLLKSPNEYWQKLGIKHTMH